MTPWPAPRFFLSAWSRWVSFLGMVAVVSALWAPVAMLAEEARTGVWGGVCSASAGADHRADPMTGATPHAAMHCDLCCTALLPLPQVPASVIPSVPGPHVAVADVPAYWAAVVAGLPFSHGPPPLL